MSIAGMSINRVAAPYKPTWVCVATTDRIRISGG